MNKVIISRMAFRKAVRTSVRLMLAVGYGLGSMFLAPAMAPEMLPTALGSNRNTPNVEQSLLADVAPAPAPQDTLQQLDPPPGTPEEALPNPPPDLPTPLVSNPKAESVAPPVLPSMGPTSVQKSPLPRQAPPPRAQEQAPPSSPAKLPAPLPSSPRTQSVVQDVPTPPAAASAQPAPTPQQEPPPYTPPEQLPPKAPQVSYEAGQLTIGAENSTLSDILAALRACMGTDIDLPASASNERMWARLGPGPARKVLATLLSQTNLDYVIQASDSDVDPDGIQSVMLTPRTDAPAGATAKAKPAFAQALPPRRSDADRRVPVPNHTPAEDRVAEEPVPPPAPPVSPEPPAPADALPATAQPAQLAVPETQGTDANKPAATASTTDQMMRMLQNMYQERKQQMQKPPATN